MELTVRLLEAGLLKEDYPITTSFERFSIQHLPKNSTIPFYILKKKDDYLDEPTLTEKV